MGEIKSFILQIYRVIMNTSKCQCRSYIVAKVSWSFVFFSTDDNRVSNYDFVWLLKYWIEVQQRVFGTWSCYLKHLNDSINSLTRIKYLQIVYYISRISPFIWFCFNLVIVLEDFNAFSYNGFLMNCMPELNWLTF